MQHHNAQKNPLPQDGGGRGRGLIAIARAIATSSPQTRFIEGLWFGALMALILFAPIGGR